MKKWLISTNKICTKQINKFLHIFNMYLSLVQFEYSYQTCFHHHGNMIQKPFLNDNLYMSYLGYQLIVVSEVGPAVDTAIGSVALVRKICLEGFHHVGYLYTLKLSNLWQSTDQTFTPQLEKSVNISARLVNS